MSTASKLSTSLLRTAVAVARTHGPWWLLSVAAVLLVLLSIVLLGSTGVVPLFYLH